MLHDGRPKDSLSRPPTRPQASRALLSLSDAQRRPKADTETTCGKHHAGLLVALNDGKRIAGGRKGEQEIGGLRCRARGRATTARLSSRRNLEPGTDIVGRGARSARYRATHKRKAPAIFGDQFFARRTILSRTNPSGRGLRRDALAGPMTEFMECGPVPIDRLEIGRRRRDLPRNHPSCCSRRVHLRCGNPRPVAAINASGACLNLTLAAAGQPTPQSPRARPSHWSMFKDG